MIKVTIQQLHVPELCKCKSHNPEAFVWTRSVKTYESHKALVDELVKWNKMQGEDELARCWVYSVMKVEEVK
jgi:hypothetical protein